MRAGKYAAVILIAALAAALQSTAQTVKLEQLAPDLYLVTGGRGANGGLYIGDNGVLVIDAKMNEESVNAFFDEIKKNTDLPVTYLVNTHSDGDHVYGNRFFPEDVIIAAHENCREEFFHPRRDGTPSQWQDPDLRAYLPSVTFRQKMDLWLGNKKVELWYFGIGHTTGDAVVYIPEAKTALIGDQVFLGRTQLIHAYKGGNSFEHVKTVSRMLETLDAETFCSGHDRPFSREDIEKHVKEMKTRQAKIRSMLEKGKDPDTVLREFPEEERRLAGIIIKEIAAGY